MEGKGLCTSQLVIHFSSLQLPYALWHSKLGRCSSAILVSGRVNFITNQVIIHMSLANGFCKLLSPQVVHNSSMIRFRSGHSACTIFGHHGVSPGKMAEEILESSTLRRCFCFSCKLLPCRNLNLVCYLAESSKLLFFNWNLVREAWWNPPEIGACWFRRNLRCIRRNLRCITTDTVGNITEGVHRQYSDGFPKKGHQEAP